MTYRLVFIKNGEIKGCSRFLDAQDLPECYVAMKPLFTECASYTNHVTNDKLHLYSIFSPESPIHHSRVLSYENINSLKKAS